MCLTEVLCQKRHNDESSLSVVAVDYEKTDGFSVHVEFLRKSEVYKQFSSKVGKEKIV
jgi:hypothetical protein